MTRAVWMAALALAGAAPAGAQERMVFAHFHLPYGPHGISVEGYKRDIRDARLGGLDGFVLNMGSWRGENGKYQKPTAMMFQAAKESDPGFRLFLSPDLSGALPPAEIVEMVKEYAGHPNYFHYKGRPVLTTWGGEGGGPKARDFWRDQVLGPLRQAGLNVFFVPMFYTADYDEMPDYEKVRENWEGPVTRSREKTPYPAWWPDVVDGMYSFGAVGLPGVFAGAAPANREGRTIPRTEEAFAKVLHEHGRLFMSSVSPLYWGANQGGGRRYYEFRGGEGIASQWQSIIERQKPEWVELFTWTDFTEATYFSPTTEAERCNWSLRTYYGDGFFGSHAGFLELNHYYVEWYKSGRRPPITEDRLFWFTRTHPKDAAAPHDRRGPVTARIGPVEDDLYLTTMLTAPAELRVTSGGRTSSINVGAGIVHTAVPFRPGEQRFSLWRGGKQVLSAAGAPIRERPARYNFTVSSGFASGTPRPDLVVTAIGWQPEQPVPGQPVTLTATVKNIGTAPTPAGKGIGVAFRVDDVPVGEGSVEGASLASGKSVVVSAAAPWPAAGGGHTVVAEVNGANAFPEANPYNNLLARTLVAGGGMSVVYAAQNEDVSIPAEGPGGWVYWGATEPDGPGPAPAGPRIGCSVLGDQAWSRYSGGPMRFLRAGGVPEEGGAGPSGGVQVAGQGNGFRVTVPADTTQRTLRLYVGGDHSEAALTARLSDGSGGTFSMPMYESNPDGSYFAVYTIAYRAASAGQTLAVEWKVAKGAGSIILQAAGLR